MSCSEQFSSAIIFLSVPYTYIKQTDTTNCSNVQLKHHFDRSNEHIKVVPRDTIERVGRRKVLNHFKLLKQICIVVRHNQVNHNRS